MKQTMPLFHKIIFKHIFHKRESIFMLPKGKFICMLKRKLCFPSFRFLTIISLFVLVFFLLYTSIERTCICKEFHFFFLKSESNLHFLIQFFEGADAACLTLRSYFYPTSLTFGNGQFR
jgi:hypothetical protein